MTLEPKQLDTQIETFTRLLQQKSIDIEPFTKAPGFLLSIASQFKALSTFEKRHENQIDDPTSGESSPCQSDSERDSRYLMPSLDEVSDLLTNELFYDVDYSIERLKEYTEKGLTLLFEDFDPNFRKQKLLNYLRDIKVSDCFSERILGVRDSKSLYFRGSHSFLVEFTVKKPDLVYDLIKTFHTYLKTETRRGVKVGRVLDDRRKRGHWYGVIIRNLPPRVSQKEIEEQCQKDVNGSIFVGTLFRIKERYCCVIRCDYLEDAELICKRLNDFQLKDRHTYEKYVIKAHIHPLSSYKHSRQDKALFTDLLKIKEKAASQKASTADKANKRGLNELLNIFVSSKKTTTTEKTEKTHGHGHGHGHSHSHSHHHDTTRRRESIEEEKVAQSSLLGETDSLLKRICSTQPNNPDDKQQDNAPESGEIMPTSALSRLMMQTSTAPTETNIEKEAKVKVETEAAPDEQVETKETVEKIEGERSKEMMEMEKPLPPSFDENINQMHYQNKLEIRKFPDRRHGERHDDNHKGSTSRSRHDKRSSSRSPYYKKPYKPKFEKGDHPHPPYQKKFFFHSNKFDQNGEERRWNNNDKEGRKPYNKHKTSKSRSRSRSKSKSPRGHRSKQHDHKRNKYQNDSSRDSPRKSRSHNRKKRTSKSKSNSNSVTKSRSRSNRRDKHKDPKNKKEHHVSTIFAYNAKDSNSEEEPSNSPKRGKKGRESKSKSPDRNRKHDNHRSSSKYYNQNRDRNKYQNDYQKGSYNRRDRHSSRDKSHRKSSDRKTSRRDRKSSRDYDKDRKKHRDSDKNRYKDKKRDRSRSRSIASKSKDKRSASRSVSSKSDRSSKGAKRRGSSSPSVDKPRTFQSKFDQRPPVPEVPVDKSDVSNGLQSRKD